MYFAKFPYIYYDPVGDGNFKIAKDILRRIAFRVEVKTQASFYFEYHVKDSDSPEIISDKIYGSPSYHWVVLLMNEMVDPYRDWPLSDRKLQSMITAKYGDGNEDDTHHYELADGTWSPDPAYAEIIEIEGNPIAISNRQHEEAENEAKRKIRLLNPKYLNLVLEEFNRRIKV